MKFLILALLFSVNAFGDETYQRRNLVGHWRSFDAPFAFGAIQIMDSGRRLTLKYCDAMELELEGICVENKPYTGSGRYTGSIDGFRMSESKNSPNAPYSIRVDPNDRQTLLRSHNGKFIRYYKMFPF